MTQKGSLEDCRGTLTDAGLSETAVLQSTGVVCHLDRLEHGTVRDETLLQYAANLTSLQSSDHKCRIPVDFWDVRANTSEINGRTEYDVVAEISAPDWREYTALLHRSFAHLCALKSGSGGTAVATALAILRETASFAHSAGDVAGRTLSRPGLTPKQQAIFLWQQILTGTHRQIPWIHRDAYSHGTWARFNVVEMWRYRAGAEISVDDIWGLTGFSPSFLGDAGNTNQIEHMAISAVAQSVLGLPVIVLNLVEELEWIMRQGTRAASKADEQLNLAVARILLPKFRVEDPEPACSAMEQALGS